MLAIDFSVLENVKAITQQHYVVQAKVKTQHKL